MTKQSSEHKDIERDRPVFSETAINDAAKVVEASIYFRSDMACRREAREIVEDVIISLFDQPRSSSETPAVRLPAHTI